MIQLILVILNIAAHIASTCGWYRLGFTLGMLAQPGWYYVGHESGVWANMVLAVFYFVFSAWGIVRENRDRGHRYGDALESVLWFFKIGWKPCAGDSYWNRRLKKTKGVNEN